MVRVIEGSSYRESTVIMKHQFLSHNRAINVNLKSVR